MLTALKKLIDDFSRSLTEQDASEPKHSLELACAVLLIEISKADHKVRPEELEHIEAHLLKHFNFEAEQSAQLLALAQDHSAEAVCLSPFISLINKHYEPADKYQLMLSMWQVAYADEEIDRYEEYRIRKLGELLYISHGDFIRAKLAVIKP